jgi:hypothetical protein
MARTSLRRVAWPAGLAAVGAALCCWGLTLGGYWPVAVALYRTRALRGRDATCSPAFDAVFAGRAVRVVPPPARAPRADASAERRAGAVRRGCLDWLLIRGPRHLEPVLREYAHHDTAARPHRALHLRPPLPRRQPVAPFGPVLRHDRLGGVLHECTRCAA